MAVSLSGVGRYVRGHSYIEVFQCVIATSARKGGGLLGYAIDSIKAEPISTAGGSCSEVPSPRRHLVPVLGRLQKIQHIAVMAG